MFLREIRVLIVLMVVQIATGPALAQEEPPLVSTPAPIPIPTKGTWVGLRLSGHLQLGECPFEPPQLPKIFEILRLEEGKVWLGSGLEKLEVGWMAPKDVYTTDETLVLIERFITGNPFDPGLILSRGLVTSGRASLPETIEILTESIKLNPRIPDLYYQRALAYEGANDRVRAFGDLYEAIRFDSSRVEFYQARARVALHLKSGHRAVQDATQALRLLPNDVPLLLIRGNAYRSLLEFPLALNDSETILLRDPKNTPALDLKSLALTGIKEYPNADDERNSLAYLQFLFLSDAQQETIPLISDPGLMNFAVAMAKTNPTEMNSIDEKASAETTPKIREKIVARVGSQPLIDAYLSYAIMARMNGNLDRARVAYSQVLVLDPNQAQAKEFIEKNLIDPAMPPAVDPPPPVESGKP